MKVVLVSSLLNYNIQIPLKNTFGNEGYYICQIPVKTGLCYSSKEDIEELKDVIRSSIATLKDTFKGHEVYIIASGGVIHNCLLVEILKEYGIKFKYLVYNKVDDKYYIVDSYDCKDSDNVVEFVK